MCRHLQRLVRTGMSIYLELIGDSCKSENVLLMRRESCSNNPIYSSHRYDRDCKSNPQLQHFISDKLEKNQAFHFTGNNPEKFRLQETPLPLPPPGHVSLPPNQPANVLLKNETASSDSFALKSLKPTRTLKFSFRPNNARSFSHFESSFQRF